ncbi:phage major capsid protein [Embleya scabrispora]|uniref:phage major capsid protein n=1 Tax=Embleya scabrispora TaxID=159449 RepID=UPI0019131F02|nr:phage major capsid protein [Embleya scabrispora]
MPTLTLTERRAALLAQLDDPEFDGDVDRLIAEADEIAGQIQQTNERAAARSRLLTQAPPEPQRPTGPQPGAVQGAPQVDSARALSIGRRFLQSEALAQYRAAGMSGTTRYDIPDFDHRAAPAGTIVTGTYPSQTQRVPGVLTAQPDLPLLVADLLDRQTSTGQTLEYVRDISGPATAPAGGWNAAAVVPEGNDKPQSDFAFELVSTSMKTLAHWVAITRQAADDEGQLQGYIEGRLSYGLRYKEDREILTGNGTTQMQGITTTSGIGTYTAAASESKLISIRRARTVAELAMYPPDGVVMHPSDWEDVELDEDGTGQFRVVANIQGLAPARLWGLAVVSTVAMTAGTFLVGGFRMGATLWERQGITILMTDSHASLFIANTLVVLAEMRANVAVHTPRAFVLGTFAA